MRWGGPARATAFVLTTLLSAATLTVAPGPTASAAGPKYAVVSSRRVAPGLRFIRLRDAATPNDAFVLRANLSRPIKFGVGLAARSVGYERTSSMASRYGAIAAVNGDFTAGGARPAHDFALGGRFLYSSVFPYRANVAVARDESARHVAEVRPALDLWIPGSPRPVLINKWNAGAPAGLRAVAFTSAGERPPPTASICSVRLRVAGRRAWDAGRQAVSRPYRVGRRRCGTVLDPRTGVTLAARRESRAWSRLRALPHGEHVSVTWSIGWPDVWSTVGGFPVIVQHGKSVAPGPCDSYFCGRNPRTGVGFTRDGALLLVVVDGRSDRSRGVTLRELAHLFLWLGATRAMNLDGGGSSTLVVKGAVKNHPSDASGERKVTSSVLVLPQATNGTTGRPAVTASSAGSGDPAAAYRDPGSTGGLVDALASGAFGPTRLNGTERRILAEYERGR